MCLKIEENLKRAEDGLLVGNKEYTVRVCDWVLREEVNNEQAWRLLRQALLNYKPQNLIKKLGSFLGLLIYKYTGKDKWLLKAMRWNVNARGVYLAMRKKLELEELALECLLGFKQNGLQYGLELCQLIARKGRPGDAVKLGERLLEEYGELAEIISVLEQSSIMELQLNSKNRAQALT